MYHNPLKGATHEKQHRFRGRRSYARRRPQARDLRRRLPPVMAQRQAIEKTLGEMAALLDVDAPNYFEYAWESRAYLDKELRVNLARDEVGLAVNSAQGRTQDQLHIHLSCVRVDVWEALHRNRDRIGIHWSLFDTSFFGHRYMAMWVAGELLGPNNPFTLLAEGLPDAPRDMADRTLVVTGLTRADGNAGFVILTDLVNRQRGDLAFGEELLDPACRLAAKGK